MARFDEKTGERLDPPHPAKRPQTDDEIMAELEAESAKHHPAKPAETKSQAPVATKAAPGGGRR